MRLWGLTLFALAMLLPNVARADWYEASSKHFVVYANDKPERIREFAEDLEKFENVMTLYYPAALKPTTGPANRVTVFVTSGPGAVSIRQLTKTRFTAGFYIPRAGANVAFVPRLSTRTDPMELSGLTVLRHEYAHHFMYTRFNAVFPIWFSEGFGEFWSTFSFLKSGEALIGAVPQHRAWGLRAGNPLPAKDLVTLANRKLNDEEREAIYGRGWLLTHYLTHDPERQKMLLRYIGAINMGESLEKAAEAFGDPKELDRALQKYMNGKFPVKVVDGAKLNPGPVELRKLTPGEVATMAVRIRSRAGVDAEEAKDVLVDARKAAAPFPDDAAAQVALAEAEFDAANYPLALAAAERAVAANPKSGEALVYRAMARLELALAADSNAETWRAVRRTIVAANRNDPEDPRPLMLFYRSFVEAGEAPIEAAKDGLIKALDTAPTDMGLRMSVAAMQLFDGKRAQASATLRPIAYHPHGGALANQARDMIAAIERGDTAEAIMGAEEKQE
jgi:tetratricopeptide (TPR) repeat protein